jgi:Fungal Zn(2)-Cys(6) binuclear cluster domain
MKNDPKRNAGEGNACLSCRQKKLKCDRKQPCSNCIARSIDCREQQLALTTNHSIKKPKGDSSILASILSRLDRIEDHINIAQLSENHVQAPSAGNDDHLNNNQPLQDIDQQPEACNQYIRAETDQMVSTSANDHILVRLSFLSPCLI